MRGPQTNRGFIIRRHAHRKAGDADLRRQFAQKGEMRASRGIYWRDAHQTVNAQPQIQTECLKIRHVLRQNARLLRLGTLLT